MAYSSDDIYKQIKESVSLNPSIISNFQSLINNYALSLDRVIGRNRFISGEIVEHIFGKFLIDCGFKDSNVEIVSHTEKRIDIIVNTVKISIKSSFSSSDVRLINYLNKASNTKDWTSPTVVIYSLKNIQGIVLLDPSKISSKYLKENKDALCLNLNKLLKEQLKNLMNIPLNLLSFSTKGSLGVNLRDISIHLSSFFYEIDNFKSFSLLIKNNTKTRVPYISNNEYTLIMNKIPKEYHNYLLSKTNKHLKEKYSQSLAKTTLKICEDNDCFLFCKGSEVFDVSISSIFSTMKIH